MTIAIAVLVVGALALVGGLLLAFADRILPAKEENLVEQVNDLLPQTQCAQCGYPGCRPYARAIVETGEQIHLCPPGGDQTVERLARLLGREVQPLAVLADPARSVAVIDEDLCIGCLHCRNACPVDAILGAPQLMHTIIASECTGCELCIAPCPVDCISMRALS